MAQGLSIEGENGAGYVLKAGFHMPPQMLTSGEIEAAILGAPWVRTPGEPEMAVEADKPLTKIDTVSPTRFQTSFVEPTTSVAPVEAQHEPLSAARIRQAIRARFKIAATYQDSSGVVAERILWPILLGYRDTGGIIAACCELRQGFRYFRTERIVSGNVLDTKIPRRMDLLRDEWSAAMTVEWTRYESDWQGSNHL